MQKTCIYPFYDGTPVIKNSSVVIDGQGGKRPMLSKCANPSCSTPLVYLREGKIFMVEAPSQQEKTAGAPAAEASSTNKPKSVNRIEHFWLCGPCSAQMTLAYDRQHGVQVVPKKFCALGAAS